MTRNSCLKTAGAPSGVRRSGRRKRGEGSERVEDKPVPPRAERIRRTARLRHFGQWSIFSQHFGVPPIGWPWTALLGRASDSRSQFAACTSRIPQIGTRRRVTSRDAEETLSDFLERYPPRPYRRRGAAAFPAAQLERVTTADGLFCLNEVPKQAPLGTPRQPDDQGDGVNCHLWVIDERGRPCISNAPLNRLGPGELRHTNLTGGSKASIGGEIWFGALPLIYLSGSSGRYPPKDREHLEDAEQLFRAVGFDVRSLGWDPETHRPLRVWLER